MCLAALCEFFFLFFGVFIYILLFLGSVSARRVQESNSDDNDASCVVWALGEFFFFFFRVFLFYLHSEGFGRVVTTEVSPRYFF